LKEEMFLPLCQWGLLVVICWNSNITTGVNYSIKPLYLSFINFKQTWYVICSSYVICSGHFLQAHCSSLGPARGLTKYRLLGSFLFM
jgi:hypothetical protein